MREGERQREVIPQLPFCAFMAYYKRIFTVLAEKHKTGLPLNKIVTLYMFSFFIFFYLCVLFFMQDIWDMSSLLLWMLVTKTHVRFKCVLHNFHESCMLNIRASCIVLESLCCYIPPHCQLALLKNKKDVMIVGAWRSWHSLSQYCFQTWGCIQGMNFVAVCMSHTWFLSEHFWYGPNMYQIVMPVFISIFLVSCHTLIFGPHG